MNLFGYKAMAARAVMAGLCLAAGALMPGFAQAQDADRAAEDLMSAMGRLAQRAANGETVTATTTSTGSKGVLSGGGSGETSTLETPDDHAPIGALGGQAETSIATDSTGQHIVIGFNDTRGFSLNPISVSGFMYSDDGGVTWTDGGQLPVTVPTSTIGSTVYPQVFGDPEVVYMGGSTFVYASIMVKKFTGTTAAQTMCVHVSTDYGHTWKGPYEVPACTNPNGQVNSTTGAPRDAADKEFMHRDPDTGRVIMSWSNFTPFATAGVEICTTYSDDIAAAAAAGVAPTWSARSVLAATANDGQSSIPRFAGNGSNDVYVLWRRFYPGSTHNTGFAKSTDNGVTWSAPTNIAPTHFFTMDQVLGNDRVNSSPSLDVHHGTGTLYAVYSNNSNKDGADVAFQRSTDGGATWSVPKLVNARPGFDRAQWFPWVTVDQSSGRVHVYYYDQGIATAGDLTEIGHTYSDDGGLTWSPQAPLTDRPFNGGYGNDTGQPNLGDYNQGIARLGELLATWAGTPEVVRYDEDYPSLNMRAVDVNFKRTSTFKAALRLGSVSYSESCPDGNIDSGETLTVQMPLESYANNAPIFTGVSATLTTTTPGVTVVSGSSTYPDVAVGSASVNTFAYNLKLSTGFVAGTRIALKLSVNSDQGSTELLHTIKTGTPQPTTILSQDFEAATVGALPSGWTSVRQAGTTSATHWSTQSAVYGGSKAAFKTNNGGPTQWMRLIGPVMTVPADADYVQIEFDVAYNTEDHPSFNVWAWDGFFLRVTDSTGAVLRSVLVEACAQDFTTGGVPHYPKHLPRSSNTSYFEDMSCWAGYSGGWKRVTMKLPGVAARKLQLRFEYTEDSNTAGSSKAPVGTPAGAAIDNIVVRSVKLINAPNTPPVADAGPDQTIECGTVATVTLDGSASYDPDDAEEPLSFEWFEGTTSIGSGPSITIDAPHDTTTYRLEVTDCRGATHSDTVTVNVVDTTPPVITLNGPAEVKHFACTPYVDAGATANDLCDGVVNVTTSGTVDTSQVGTYTITYTATDDAGNTATATRTVKVIYDWSNVLEPINVDGSSIFKLGSTVPVKFRLVGGCVDKQDLVAKLYLRFISATVTGDELEPVSTSAADSGNVFRYSNGDGGQYIYNLSTKGLSEGTWQLRIDLGDGETHTVNISIKK